MHTSTNYIVGRSSLLISPHHIKQHRVFTQVVCVHPLDLLPFFLSHLFSLVPSTNNSHALDLLPDRAVALLRMDNVVRAPISLTPESTQVLI